MSQADEPDVALGGPATSFKEIARRVTLAALTVVTSPQYPLSAFALAAMFLMVQDRIDRRDPKLAVARVTQRDDRVGFPDLFPLASQAAGRGMRLRTLAPAPPTALRRGLW